MVETLPQLFLNTVRAYPKDAFLFYKKNGAYTPISTQDFESMVKFLSLGLKELGFQPGDKLVILSENRPEWVITDLAVQCAGGITVPVYTSLVPEQVGYIIDDSDASFVVVSNAEQWDKVKAVKSQIKKVRRFITFAPETPEDVFGLTDVMHKGQERAAHNPLIFDKEALAFHQE